MHKLSAFSLIGLLCVGLWAGCQFAASEPPEPPSPSPEPSNLPGRLVREKPEGPAEKDGFINMEGMDNPFRFYRLDAAELGMVTYFPHDLVTEPISNQDGDEVRIWAAFTGTKVENIYLSLLLFNEGVTVDEVMENTLARLTAEGFTLERIEGDNHPSPWAVAAYWFRGKQDGVDYTGTVSFGNRENRPLVVKVQATLESAEGFYPRYHYILDEMQWYGLED